MLHCDYHIDNLIGYGHMTLSKSRCVNMKPLNRNIVMARFVTHASTSSTYLINGFIILAFPCVMLKVICAGVGWVWLVRLAQQQIKTHSLHPYAAYSVGSWSQRTIRNPQSKEHFGGGKMFLGMNLWLCLPNGLLG